jgi:hypothetical protein
MTFGWVPPTNGPPEPRKSWPRRHKIATILLSVGSLVVVLIVGGVIGAALGNPKTAHAGSTVATTAPATVSQPSASPAPPPLSAGETKFVAAIRSGLGRPGYSNTGTDADIATVGSQICSARQSGNSQSTVVAALRRGGNQWALPLAKVVKAAEKNMCRQYLPKPPRVTARFNGSGIQNTTSFTVPAQWHLSWAYWGCSGGTGNFIVEEYNTDGSPDSNGVTVNELGSGRGPVATYAYGDSGQHYFSVDSECSWSLAVVVGG